MFLVTCLGQSGRRCDRQLANDGHPVGVGRLPCALVFTTRIGPVGDLIPVGRRGERLDGQRGLGDRLEAYRDSPKVKVDIGNHLSSLHGDGVESESLTLSFAP